MDTCKRELLERKAATLNTEIIVSPRPVPVVGLTEEGMLWRPLPVSHVIGPDIFFVFGGNEEKPQLTDCSAKYLLEGIAGQRQWERCASTVSVLSVPDTLLKIVETEGG